MMTWNEMVQKYPDKWIVIQNAVMDGPDIISGDVHAVISDDEIIEYRDESKDDSLIFRRTKGGLSNGPVRANFIVEVN